MAAPGALRGEGEGLCISAASCLPCSGGSRGHWGQCEHCRVVSWARERQVFGSIPPATGLQGVGKEQVTLEGHWNDVKLFPCTSREAEGEDSHHFCWGRMALGHLEDQACFVLWHFSVWFLLSLFEGMPNFALSGLCLVLPEGSVRAGNSSILPPDRPPSSRTLAGCGNSTQRLCN